MPPRITPLVAGLPATVPFVGPETQERQRGTRFRARIGANENGFGPSPKAVAAMAEAAGEVWKYCDPENWDLKQALARHLGVGPENVVVGEGIDGLLGLTVRLVVEPGLPVVTSLGAYPTFNFHVAGFGGRLVTVPFADDREDPEALAAAARAEDARLVYFSNPNNPMASWWPGETVVGLMDAVPDDAILCVDEAYGEFAPDGTLPPIDVSRPNVLRFRTFSKAYGMAGARIAYAVGAAPLIREFDKIRNHFGVNRIAQAGALAALGDTAHLAWIRERIVEARARIVGIAEANGLKPLPSATNFVTVDCGRDGAFARRLLVALAQRGVFVRMPGVAPQDRCIRIGCGPAADLDVLEAELPAALAVARREA
ncbi:pyridoxal phosphate-dependent aminotransferase [Prosthecomicrobium hirschii]|uniref:pyridoxal phosphate-dependent aminotransferase n=2 Tax=Prosthecodimorpha hirschii TaxID=665126 RepID=UPI00221F6732|nr:pyridoxal phosphate-dependent aminotransferase [Prosthecomicrobium hirschii]MCW1841185.1 pyridoxal phosphate-dependent aminotransferase [Prosthecomicrobium hirschii]